MEDRALMAMYALGGAGVAGLGWAALRDWSAGRRGRVLSDVAGAAALVALVWWLAAGWVRPEPLDLSRYPWTARVTVMLVFFGLGWVYSFAGQRRWRSTSLREDRAAYRAGAMWEGYGPLGRVMLRAALLAVGIAMALPELFMAGV